MKTSLTISALSAAILTAIILSFNDVGRGQTESESPNIVKVSTVPASGTFWSIQLTNYPPLFSDPYPQLPLYSDGTPGQYFFDDHSIDYGPNGGPMSAEVAGTGNGSQRRFGAMDDGVPSPPGGGGGGSGGSGGTGQVITFYPPTNGYVSCETYTNFWLEITQSSGAIDLTISNTLPSLSYWLLEKTNLTDPYWEVIQTLTASGSTLSGTPVSAGTNGTLFFAAVLATNEEAPIITQQPTNQVVGLGTNAVFTVTATGYPALSYQWQLNGTNLSNGGNISGVTTNRLTITGVRTNNVGNYTVIVSNILCTADATAGLGLIWSSNLTNSIDASPTVAPSGAVYIATTGSQFLGLGASGNAEWSKPVVTGQTGDITGSATVAPTGNVIYIGTQNGYLDAFNPSGALIWSNNLGGYVSSTPAVGSDGTIYVTTEYGSPGGLFAISTNGSQKWLFQTDSPSGSGQGDGADSSPAITPNCSIVFLADGNDLYDISMDGSLNWFFPLPSGSTPDSSPAVDAEGNIYIGSRSPGGDTYVYSINPVGQLRWIYDTGDASAIQSSPTIGPDGTVYIASTDGNLYALSSSGALLWKFNDPNSNPFISSPAIAEGNVVVIGSEDEYLYAITNGVVKWTYQAQGAILSSPAINPLTGAIIFADEAGYVYSIPGVSGPASSDWSMFHGNAAHLGAAPFQGCVSQESAFPNNPALSPDGPNTFSFDLSGPPGTLWIVYSSSDLVNWQPLGVMSLSSERGVGSFTDNNIAGVTNRFYQARMGSVCSQVIGLVNLTVSSGTNLIAYQLNQVNDGVYPQNTPQGWYDFLAESFAVTNVPNLSEILKWNGQAFDADTLNTETLSWTPNGNITLLPGQSEFFYNPTNYPATIPIAGVVTPGPSTNIITPGSNYLSSVIPASGRLQHDLNYIPNQGDKVLLWHGTNYSTNTYVGSSWTPSEPSLEVGQGFLLVTTNANLWVQDFSPCSSSQIVPPPESFTNAFGSTGTAIDASPAFGPDGSVYIATGSAFGSSSGSLFFALNSDGTVRWADPILTGQTDAQITSSAAVSSNGAAIYVGSQDGYLYSFNTTTGATNWHTFLGGYITATPALETNGTIVVGTTHALENNISAIDPTNGEIYWSYELGSNLDISSSAAIGPDCTIYAMNNQANAPGLLALYPNGVAKWFLPLFGNGTRFIPTPSAALDANGNVYVADGKFVIAVSPQELIQWTCETPDSQNISSSLTIGSDQTVYGGTTHGALFAITNGAIAWAFTNVSGSAVVSTPAVDSNNVVYFEDSSEGLFYAVADGLLQWEFSTGAGAYSSPAISGNGTLCFGGFDGNLYFLPVAPLQSSAWPMFQKAPAHFGTLAGSACYANNCDAPVLFNVASTGSSNFSFNVVGIPGTSWTVVGKGDAITNWTGIGGVTLDATGSGSFLDAQGETGSSYRLYRVVNSNCCSQIAGIATIMAYSGSNLVTEPFIETDSDGEFPANTLAAISDANNIPNGSEIEEWNGHGLNVYRFSNTNGNQWSLNSVENEAGLLVPGQAAWLYNASADQINITFAGLLPNGDGQVANPVALGTNYLASLLPLSGTISSSLQYAPNAGDVVHLWKAQGIQFFNSYTNTNSTAGGWSPSQPGIPVGEGFILDAAQTNVWVQDTYPCVWATNFIILVPAYPLWTDTGLSVESNGTITISASGSWTGGQGNVGPGGLNTTNIDLIQPYTLFLTNTVAPHDSLIAFVGPNPFDAPDGENEWNLDNGYFPQPPGQGYWEVGTNVVFVSTNRAGELWLGINDDSEEADTSDNTGHVTAIVQVQ